jgi:hypothetical protein
VPKVYDLQNVISRALVFNKLAKIDKRSLKNNIRGEDGKI